MHRVSGLVLGFLLLPDVAVAAPQLSLGTVFADANLIMKIIMVLLLIAALSAIVVTVGKIARGNKLSGGSAFVSALRIGGPLLGLLGAVYVVLTMFIGIANAGMEVPLAVLAPGFAEAALLFLLGLFSGAVGVLCHWAIDARIDRTVLGA